MSEYTTARAGDKIKAGDMLYLAPRFRWLPKWLMFWSWFRVAKTVTLINYQHTDAAQLAAWRQERG